MRMDDLRLVWVYAWAKFISNKNLEQRRVSNPSVTCGWACSYIVMDHTDSLNVCISVCPGIPAFM